MSTEVDGRRFFSLLRDKNFVGGKWVASSSGKTFPVTNPVNDQIIGTAQDSTSQDAESAIGAAAESFKSWASTSGKQRGNLLRNLLNLVNTHTEELAKLMTAECGKPLPEARGEVIYSASTIYCLTIFLLNLLIPTKVYL